MLVGGQEEEEEGGMNRRGFLKSMLIMAGAACLGLVRLAPRMAKLTVTDPKGRITWKYRPVHIVTGDREIWHGYNPFDPNPVWEKGALPSLYFVNRRIAGPLETYLGGSA